MLMQKFLPSMMLNDYIECYLVQEDFNPSNFANRNPVKVLPTSMTVIGIQYGKPMLRMENNKAYAMGSSGITGLQTTVKEYVSTGSIGTIIIQFKVGGLSQFTTYPIHEFQNMNVPLDLIFPRQSVQDMEEQLADAADARERVDIVQRFLQSMLRRERDDQLIVQIARQILRQAGRLSVEQLAGEWYMSKRTLERKFNALIGASPKRYANIARFQYALQLRKVGLDYLDIVFKCGYTDHAHFAKDFKTFSGCSPEQLFRSEIQPELSKFFNESEVDARSKQSMYY